MNSLAELLPVMDGTVDLHNHTWYSDGLFSPAETVALAKERGIRTMSVTDHDGTEGLAEAFAAGQELGVEVIPGVEVSSVDEEGKDLHILGYCFDPSDVGLAAFLARLRAYRKERNDRLIAALKEAGYPISFEELLSRPAQTYVGKPNMARVLVEKGYFNSVESVFKELFFASPFREIQKVRVSPEEAVSAIRDAGGYAVLAHPGKIRGIGAKGSPAYYDAIRARVVSLTEAGLSGLECSHPSHTERDEAAFLALAAEFDLAVTRGSDFHGDDTV